MGRETAVVVADGQRLLADALTVALADRPDVIALPWCPATMEEAVEAAVQLRPAVVVLDHWMPGRLDALAATAAIVEASPSTAVVVTSGVHGAGHIDAALAAGAAGFVPKSESLEGLHDAVVRAAAGERPVRGGDLAALSAGLRRRADKAEREWAGLAALSRRELEVLRGLARGLSVPRLAPQLHLSPGTVRNHVQNILKKTGARSQREVIRLATASGLVGGRGDGPAGAAPSGPGPGGAAAGGGRRRARQVPPGTTPVLVADGQRLFAEAVGQALGHYPGLEVVSVAWSGQDALSAAVDWSPAVAVYDYWMPGTSGPAAARYLAAWSPLTAVVVSSWLHGPSEIERAAGAGAAGMVSKRLSLDQLVETVRAAAAGEDLAHAERTTKRARPHPAGAGAGAAVGAGGAELAEDRRRRWERLVALSPRELEVLRLLAAGHTMKQIAATLAIAVGTSRNHVRSILAKLAASTSAEAVRVAHDEGLVREVGLPGAG